MKISKFLSFTTSGSCFFADSLTEAVSTKLFLFFFILAGDDFKDDFFFSSFFVFCCPS